MLNPYVGATTIYSNEFYGFAQTFMMYDIAALQYMYGADYTTNSGDTVYTWSSTNGRAFVDGELALDPGANRIFETIWDGGGTDTYDLSNYSTNLEIDLAPGGHSTFDEDQLARLGDDIDARGNVFNALRFEGDGRSVIENATGGDGNDAILGNGVDNLLRGNDGDDKLSGSYGEDTLRGGDGEDRLVGDSGADSLSGGDGDDRLSGGSGDDLLRGGRGEDVMRGNEGDDDYYVGRSGDEVIENSSAGGLDRVYSTITYRLPTNVEQLVLTSSGAVSGTGNNDDNLLRGAGGENLLRGRGGADTLSGGLGEDTLVGGTGSDTFRFTSASDPDVTDIIRAGDDGAAFFRPGERGGDLIDLSSIDADRTVSGNQSFTFGGPHTAGHIWLDNPAAIP